MCATVNISHQVASDQVLSMTSMFYNYKHLLNIQTQR